MPRRRLGSAHQLHLRTYLDGLHYRLRRFLRYRAHYLCTVRIPAPALRCACVSAPASPGFTLDFFTTHAHAVNLHCARAVAGSFWRTSHGCRARTLLHSCRVLRVTPRSFHWFAVTVFVHFWFRTSHGIRVRIRFALVHFVFCTTMSRGITVARLSSFCVLFVAAPARSFLPGSTHYFHWFARWSASSLRVAYAALR